MSLKLYLSTLVNVPSFFSPLLTSSNQTAAHNSSVCVFLLLAAIYSSSVVPWNSCACYNVSSNSFYSEVIVCLNLPLKLSICRAVCSHSLWSTLNAWWARHVGQRGDSLRICVWKGCRTSTTWALCLFPAQSNQVSVSLYMCKKTLWRLFVRHCKKHHANNLLAVIWDIDERS